MLTSCTVARIRMTNEWQILCTGGQLVQVMMRTVSDATICQTAFQLLKKIIQQQSMAAWT